MQSDDELVEIKFTKDRVNPYRYTEHGERLKRVGSITLRFVKVTLKSGVVEYLLTNLAEKTFKTDDIYTLYGFRRGIKTVYDTLKNKLMLINSKDIPLFEYFFTFSVLYSLIVPCI